VCVHTTPDRSPMQRDNIYNIIAVGDKPSACFGALDTTNYAIPRGNHYLLPLNAAFQSLCSACCMDAVHQANSETKRNDCFSYRNRCIANRVI
jgi:hypothetical protein